MVETGSGLELQLDNIYLRCAIVFYIIVRCYGVLYECNVHLGLGGTC